jgi:signal transduction histidine kinase
MKKLTVCFVVLFMCLQRSFAQTDSDIVSFRQIPIGLHIQIGFLFVYVLLGLLFLMIFLFYPRERLNLYFSLYNISLALMVINTQYFKSGPYAGIATEADGLISRLIGVNILLFIVYALDRAKPFFWWLAAFILFLDFPLSIILKQNYSPINEIVHAAFTLVCFWQAVVAFGRKEFASWLVGFAALAVVLINIGSLLYFVGHIEMVTATVLGITPFVVTICVVIYLALRYSRTNISLEHQLIQVKELSDLNLQKEREKQQLLADQNETLEKQVMERTMELKNSLTELRSTQAQLIQQEKMASLGELTAGIAHEIQNPLNFVNNFSEVSNELIDEMTSELAIDNRQSAINIAGDVKQNLEKIIHHGKRADAIVKGMLQHSRASSGQREPTDINAFADEYLRLAYHGFRAKDKSFHAKFETDLDPTIEKINVVPQDMGRVLLNLINNAFYAVDEKKRQLDGSYEPCVSISTRRVDNKVEIKVKDNGNGIPQKVKDKIFQPFFTTKPTGAGTGLGLSLSYDIITKGHGGELKVETEEGEGSVFSVTLPV